MSCSIVPIPWSVVSNSIMTLLMREEEETEKADSEPNHGKQSGNGQKGPGEHPVDTSRKPTSQLISRDCNTFSVGHVANMVILLVTVYRGDMALSLRVGLIWVQLLSLKTPCKCIVLQTIVIRS